MYPVANLGESGPAGYTVARALVEEGVEAVDLIETHSEKQGTVHRSCWRDITVRKWPGVKALDRKLMLFLQSPYTELRLSKEEFELLDQVLSCADDIRQDSVRAVEKRMSDVSAVAGTLAGFIVIISYFSR